MATRLQASFTSISGEVYNIYIDDSSYGGAAIDVLTGSQGFSMRMNGESDLVGIMGSRVTIPVMVTPSVFSDMESFSSDLETAPEGRFTLKITYKAAAISPAELFWVGYILPDQSGFEDAKVYVFNISATDGLARLKGIEYKDTGDVPFGNEKAIDHILECLNKDTLSALYYSASTDIFLRTVVNWHDNNIGSPSASVCPLTRMRYQGEVFAKIEGIDDDISYTFSSCYDVLVQHCIHFHARLYFSKGCYRFEQINERWQDTFYERRFSRNGTLISSSASTGYDKTIDQTSDGSRLATNIFQYLSALKRVEVEYDHKTYRNHLEGVTGKWHGASTSNSAYFLNYIPTDSDTIFKISGRCSFHATIPTYLKPWRQEFKMNLATLGSSKWLRREAKSAVDGSGNATNTISFTPPKPQWDDNNYDYELSSNFIFGSEIYGYFDFVIYTPEAPADTTGLSIDFEPLAAWDNKNVVISSAVLHHWQFSNLILQVIGTDEAANNELLSRYILENPVDGNSDVLKIEEKFGHAVKPWCIPKIQTSADGSSWSDTTASWKQGANSTSYEFGQLLAAEIMSARKTPTRTITGEITGSGMFPHVRITTPDLVGWIMSEGEFDAQLATWSATWVSAGIDRITSVVIKKKVAIPGDTIKVSPEKGVGFSSNSLPPAITNGSHLAELGKSDIAIAAVSVNKTSAVLSAGAITSIPLEFPCEANAYNDGDDIFVVNPETSYLVGFTVNADAADGATSLSVGSVTIEADFPIGSHIVYSALNKFTKQGGGGGNIPPGTAQGQILRWNNTDHIWEVNSGSIDGHVLTWDTTNGWQAEAPTGGGISGSGADNYVAVWSGSGTLTYDNASNNQYFYDRANHRLGLGTATPAVRIHYLGSLYGINGQHQFGRYNQTPATPYSAVEFEGLQADPISVSSPGEDAVMVVRAMSNVGVRASTTLAFGVWSGGSDLYGAWIQARDRAAFNTYRPILMQPRGGKLAVGRVTSVTNSAQLTVKYGAYSSSSGAGNYVASFEGGTNGEGGDNKVRIGLAINNDQPYSSFMWDNPNVITRIANLTGGTLPAIRFSIGTTETSDKAIITLSNTIGRFGAGFSSVTDLVNTLQSYGSFGANCRSVTGTTFTMNEDHWGLIYTGTAASSWTIPAAASAKNRMYVIGNMSSYTISLSVAWTYKNGASTNQIYADNWLVLFSNGINWYGFKVNSLG